MGSWLLFLSSWKRNIKQIRTYQFIYDIMQLEWGVWYDEKGWVHVWQPRQWGLNWAQKRWWEVTRCGSSKHLWEITVERQSTAHRGLREGHCSGDSKHWGIRGQLRPESKTEAKTNVINKQTGTVLLALPSCYLEHFTSYYPAELIFNKC